MVSIISWLTEWYNSNCNGDWEHCYGISIDTLDNPGWIVTIELHETALEESDFVNISIDNGEKDWLMCEVKDNIFFGRGDQFKLPNILEIFKSFAESCHVVKVGSTEQNFSNIDRYGRILPWIESWDEFLERFVSNREQFLLVYDCVNIWIIQRMDRVDYLLTDIRRDKLNIIESAEYLLKKAAFNNNNINEIWRDVKTFTLTHQKELPYYSSSYEELLYQLILHKGCYKIVYGNQTHIINYLDTHEYKRNGTITLTESFRSPEAMIENARIFGKGIREIVDELLST